MKTTILIILFHLLSVNTIAQNSELKALLIEISSKAIELNSTYFSTEQVEHSWIGFAPANDTMIIQLEQRLKVKLPQDFKDFLLITNGFRDANGVEPSFCALSKIDYLKNVDQELIDIWNFPSDKSFTENFKSAIQVGGFDEEQQFYLIPPGAYNTDWEYWHFAAWSPGEAVYTSLLDYFNHVLETTNQFLLNK